MVQGYVTVDLGDAGADERFEPPGEPVPAWQRRVVFAVVFAFGVLIGVLGWQARLDNAVEIELVAAGTEVQRQTERGDSGLRHVGLNLYNAGPHDVTLVGLALSGWEPETPDQRNQTLRASAWTPVDVTASPTCDVPVPDEIIATVRGDTEDVTVTLALPPDRGDLGGYADACVGVAAPLTVTPLQSRQWLNSRAGELLVTPVVVAGSVADNTLVGVSASSDGLSGEPIARTGPLFASGRVDIVWQITDCARAADIEEIAFDVTVDSVAGQRSETVAVSDPYLTYVLGNYVAREC